MKVIDYKTSGTCARYIHLEIDDNGLIADVSFSGGCNGNLKGISLLAKGKKANEVAEMLKGTLCGSKETSCPDQLSKAISKVLSEA